jgi:hypothetical protein
MKHVYFVAGVLALISAPSVPAYADVWSPYVTIVSVTQSNGDNTLYINTYPTISPSTTNCTNTTLYLQATNGAHPSYTTLAPYIMAAFLYNKSVSFDISGCAFSGADPIVGGIAVQQ